jgi:hypothetical protein
MTSLSGQLDIHHVVEGEPAVVSNDSLVEPLLKVRILAFEAGVDAVSSARKTFETMLK